MNLYSYLGVSNPFDLNNIHVTSPVVSSLVLAQARLLLASYTLLTLLFTLIRSAVRDHYANDVDQRLRTYSQSGLCNGRDLIHEYTSRTVAHPPPLAYDFLDPEQQKGLLAAYIIGILGCYCIAFLVVRFLIILRIRLVARRRENAVPRESITEWEEVEDPTKDSVV
ncbi:hypothetical protein C0989_000384 [Termitomyces sp. Mn162]|nr:hypothetical protein C0989_000384 [Termitomyces sp. Mn162]